MELRPHSNELIFNKMSLPHMNHGTRQTAPLKILLVLCLLSPPRLSSSPHLDVYLCWVPPSLLLLSLFKWVSLAQVHASGNRQQDNQDKLSGIAGEIQPLLLVFLSVCSPSHLWPLFLFSSSHWLSNIFDTYFLQKGMLKSLKARKLTVNTTSSENTSFDYIT